MEKLAYDFLKKLNASRMPQGEVYAFLGLSEPNPNHPVIRCLLKEKMIRESALYREPDGEGGFYVRDPFFEILPHGIEALEDKRNRQTQRLVTLGIDLAKAATAFL